MAALRLLQCPFHEVNLGTVFPKGSKGLAVATTELWGVYGLSTAPQRAAAAGLQHRFRVQGLVEAPPPATTWEDTPHEDAKPVQSKYNWGIKPPEEALSSDHVAEAAVESSPIGRPFELVQQEALALGTLDIVRLAGDRMLRIWKPPGYNPLEGGPEGHPVLFLNDGQNLFDASLSISGASWRCAETCSDLITTGLLPPFLVVGIDHAGPMRSYEYTPYKPGTGPGGFRQDAAKWPGGAVDAYLDAVVSEILPFVTERYNCSRDPARVAFGGSSFGGVCALRAAMRYSHVFGSVLVESPSLWLANEKFLKEDLATYSGPWPTRTYIATGTLEFSGTRAPNNKRQESDELIASYVPRLVGILERLGVPEGGVQASVEKGGAHTESAWARRLPGALNFLLSPLWDSIAARNANNLYFTSPKRVKAGTPAVLFLNKARSDTLAGSPSVKLVHGFNNWQGGLSHETLMEKATQLPPGEGTDWWVAPFEVPKSAYDVDFVFSDKEGQIWDNNAGNNFFLRVKPKPVEPPIPPPLDQLARQHASSLFFTFPPVPKAGQPATLFMNRKRSWQLSNSPNVKIVYGFNMWTVLGEGDLKPTSLWRGEEVDWWSVPLKVPGNAEDVMEFAFTDGNGTWDNNDSKNFRAPIKSGGAIIPPRTVDSVETLPHAAGTMEILTLVKRGGKSRWTEEKRVRVWLPPGYDREKPPPGGYPVLYLNDGQNMFECWLAHQGVSWRAGYTASELILSGQLPPFIIAAIDSAGAMRSLNYLPYEPGTGVGGFRGDCERWPGGGLDDYMRRVVEEIIPLVSDRYGCSTDPSRVAFGGGSFAGVAALYAAMKYPHVFGAVLAESPSLWIAEARFLSDMEAHKGMLPERIFMGCGTREYSATRDHDREDVDALLLHYYMTAARVLRDKGMRGNRLYFQVEEGAGHHELAWQWRLTGAMQFLLSSWWDA